MINILIALAILIYLYDLYVNMINYSKPEKRKLYIAVPEIPLLQVEKPTNSIIQSPDIWNLKTPKDLSFLQQNLRNQSLDIQCITYNPIKSGKIYVIKTSTGNSLKFFGIVVKERKKYAIFYDSSRKEKKIFLVSKREKIDKFLLLKDIKSDSIILENLSNCPQKQIITLEILSINMTKYQKQKEEAK